MHTRTPRPARAMRHHHNNAATSPVCHVGKARAAGNPPYIRVPQTTHLMWEHISVQPQDRTVQLEAARDETTLGHLHRSRDSDHALDR